MRWAVLTLTMVGAAAKADELPPFEIEATDRLNVSVTHEFSESVARERVCQLLAYWAERFGVKSQWRGAQVFLTGSVLGFDIRALFELRGNSVVGVARNPGAITGNAIRSYVDKKLRKYLHPKYEEP